MKFLITLVSKDGNYAGRKAVCEDHRTYVIGRGDDCPIRLPSDKAHRSISRHHCQFEIEFPRVRVRDCGSNNGTFVNGVQVKPPEHAHSWKAVFGLAHTTTDIRDGDEIRLGGMRFKVLISPIPEGLGKAPADVLKRVPPAPARKDLSDAEEVHWVG